MYDEIFSQITNAANKRNLRDYTINAYCTSVAHFLKYIDKDYRHPARVGCDTYERAFKKYVKTGKYLKTYEG